MQDLLPRVGCGFLERGFASVGSHAGGVGVSPLTHNLCHAPPVAWQKLMRSRTQVELQARSGWKFLYVKGWCLWCCSTLAGSGWHHCVWGGVVGWHWWHFVFWCCQMLCGFSGIVCRLSVVRKHFTEIGHPWGTGWWCYGCVLLPPSQSIEYTKGTLPALATISLQQTWLNGHGWISCTSWCLCCLCGHFVFVHTSCSVAP